MSNMRDHLEEQARIIAECAAGECDHPECRSADEDRIFARTGFRRGDRVLFHGKYDGVIKAHDGGDSFIVTGEGGETICTVDEMRRIYRSELTDEGQQYVIPGCEKDEAPGVTQRELF